MNDDDNPLLQIRRQNNSLGMIGIRNDKTVLVHGWRYSYSETEDDASLVVSESHASLR